MMDALYSAATGMSAQQTSMDVIANNLANANTTGFKGTDLSFQDLLYTQMGSRQASAKGAQVGMGVAPGRMQLDFSQGSTDETGKSTDMMISGQGFFQVQNGNQVAYTRDGNFSVDANGQLVTQNGNILLPSVVIPESVNPDTVNVAPNGIVTGNYHGKNTIFGQIQLAGFPNPDGLQSLGNNLFQPTVNSGSPFSDNPGQQGLGLVHQGELEESNVQTMQQMIDMISAQRTFESVSKVISASDQMLSMANQIQH